MIQTIITHPGGAHKDDLLACAVLLAQAPVPIERREPLPADLDDPQTAVVDIGHEHAPERLNFDHHQFPREQAPTCALSLVFQYLGIYEDARQFCEWLEVAEWFDCRGPVETANWLGISRETVSKLNSPMDVALLRGFAAQSRHSPGEPLWEVLRTMGTDLVNHIKGLRSRLDFIDKTAEVWTLKAGEQAFKVLYMPRGQSSGAEPSAGMGRYIFEQGLENEIFAMVYPDRRGIGYGLRRFNDMPRMDFTRIEGEPDVHFTHKQGFIAKTDASSVERLKVLVERSFVE